MFDIEKPWTRQPIDDPLSWPVFLDYLSQLPPRDCSRLVRPGLPWSRIERMAVDGAWKGRAQAWDADRDAKRQSSVDAFEDKRREIAMKLLDAVSAEASRLCAVPIDTAPGLIPPKDLATITDLAMTLMSPVENRRDTEEDLGHCTVEQLHMIRTLSSPPGMVRLDNHERPRPTDRRGRGVRLPGAGADDAPSEGLAPSGEADEPPAEEKQKP